MTVWWFATSVGPEPLVVPVKYTCPGPTQAHAPDPLGWGLSTPILTALPRAPGLHLLASSCNT